MVHSFTKQIASITLLVFCCLVILGQGLPRLTIARGSNQTVVVSWPSTETGFLLQPASALAASNWQASALTPLSNFNSGTFSFVAPTTNPATFYRLAQTSQITISLGATQQVFHFGHPDSLGLFNVPDQHLSVLQQTSNSYLVWITGNIGTNGGSVARLATSDFAHYTNAGARATANAEAVFTPSCDGVTASCLANIDADYVGANAVIRAANGRDLLMFYEAGTKSFGGTNYGHSDGEYNVIALARSADTGLTWIRQGAVISGPDPTPQAPPGTSQPGVSEPGLIAAHGFLYMYFQYIPNEPTEPGAPSVIQVARAPVAADGAPGTWVKYYQKSFGAEPGLGGRADTIVATGTGTGCTRPVQVWPAFNTYLNAYVLLFLANEGWFFCTSTDLVHWTSPSNFMPEVMWRQCEPMDWNYIFVTPGNPAGVISQTGYVLFAHTDAKGLNCSSGFTPHELWLAPFTFSRGELR